MSMISEKDAKKFFEVECAPLRGKFTRQTCIINQEKGVPQCHGCPTGKDVAGGKYIKPIKKKPGDAYRLGLYLKKTKESDHMKQYCEVKSKICRKCGKEKPIEEFGANVKTKDGRRHICKTCVGIKISEARRLLFSEKTPLPLTLDFDRWSPEIRDALAEAAATNIRNEEQQAIAYIIRGLKQDGIHGAE